MSPKTVLTVLTMLIQPDMGTVKATLTHMIKIMATNTLMNMMPLTTITSTEN